MDHFTLYTLPCGTHDDPANPNWKIEIVDYRGLSVIRQFDLRGEDFGEIITVERNAIEWDFNTIQDATDWIDAELDTDHDFDPVREWGVGASRAI